MEEKKIYQIPRKVEAGLQFLGLGVKEMAIMFIPLMITIGIWFLPLDFKFKIFISIFFIYGTYLMLTTDLNGQTGFQFLWGLFLHVFKQKNYSLTTSNDFNEPDLDLGEYHLIKLERKSKKGDLSNVNAAQIQKNS
ncbi:hypothetical protein A8L34_28230 [Bacillus sp. FJAT-27264]|uniref:hypothetical protein n=1 Tax=Paenibacillus sp. (strain DSM 101736 / FJAT-27264) TaxID=1850362 RepID=UPI00080806AA|nr:hypothetical protein [Bacillus sp. FJAT-27264]OBZ15937.1 hypothetical protein A8L34_28230 [Bacillus sp. FJAT-27264]